MIFEEKYLSCYILLADQISMSDWLFFVRYWSNMCTTIVCSTGRDVTNFEINLTFLIKSFFLHDQKVKTKIVNILKRKRAFKIT